MGVDGFAASVITWMLYGDEREDFYRKSRAGDISWCTYHN